MSIEKCVYFKKFMENNQSWCTIRHASANCAGFSDLCKYPESFKPYRDVLKESITFNPPSLEELAEKVSEEWRRRG